jgi:hypothetical protein
LLVLQNLQWWRFCLVWLFRKVAVETEFKLQQMLCESLRRIKALFGSLNAEDEDTESMTALYIVSFMLLASLVFLSPDKLPQVIMPPNMGSGIVEKALDAAKLIRRLVPI